MSLLRTDLVVEQAQQFEDSLPQGVSVEEYTRNGVGLTRVTISSEQGARALGRAQGQYITIDLPTVDSSVSPADDATHLLANELASMLPSLGPVLVVGLGNSDITPDALGPLAARQIFATRHIPEQVAKQTGLTGLRSVSALAPGVLGQTGIETSEIIRSMVRDLQPAAVLVIDALAARSLDRLGRTIQLADQGIAPGAGVLNSRKELSKKTLGVPVISIGIPTVVDGATMVSDLMDPTPENVPERARTVMVTPRDIDAVIARGARHLSLAINSALQPRLSIEEISYLVS